MSTMQSTLRKVEEDETRKAEGWEPAGPPMTADLDLPQRTFPDFGEAIPAVHGPLPSIGHMVVYHLRDGDSRNMRTKFPAVVLDVDQSTGLLSLIITVDAGDEWRQDHVPARKSPEPGWELVNDGPDELSLNVARLGDRVAALEDLAGINYPKFIALGSEEFVHDMRPGGITWAKQSEQIEARIAALEAKRPPGRPPKPKD